MALQAVVADLDGVPEALRQLYQPVDGAFVLDLEGIEEHPSARALKNAKDREAEERKRRGERVAELEQQLKAFDGIDPAAAQAALAEVEAAAGKQLIDPGEVDQLVNGELERVRGEHEREVEAIGAQLRQAEVALAEVRVFGAIKDAAIKAGVRDSALDDVVNRARAVWRLVDGVPTAIKPGAQDEAWLDRDGEPVDMADWMDHLAREAAHLFKPNRGGGALGSGANGDGRRMIDIAQPNAIGRHLEAFAKGEITAV